MSTLFPNQDIGRTVLKHKKLPVYITDEFNFFRCLALNDSFYGKTVSELFAGNLREGNKDNRYSQLFPGKKVSYWADTFITAVTEVRYHNRDAKGYILFWAYDDATSTFPTLADREPLIIADGRDLQFGRILEKHEKGECLSTREKALLEQIAEQDLDCLVYDSLRHKGGLNYLFFEKGFHKLSLREVTLRFKRSVSSARNTIVCAISSDFSPSPEQYGCYFAPKAKVKMDDSYLLSEEFLSRKAIMENSHLRYREAKR